MHLLTTQQEKMIRDLRDKMLEDAMVSCRVLYTPVWADCTEHLNLADSTAFSNIGLHGGPVGAVCPMCNGTNKIQVEVTDTIDLVIDWLPNIRRRNIRVDATNIQVPYDLIEAKGYLKDVGKLQQSIEIQINLPNSPHMIVKYRRVGDGIDSYCITKGRYFDIVLERIP